MWGKQKRVPFQTSVSDGPTWSQRRAGDPSSAVGFCWTECVQVRLVWRSAALLRLVGLKGSVAGSRWGRIPGRVSIIGPRRRREPLHDGIHHASVSGSCCRGYVGVVKRRSRPGRKGVCGATCAAGSWTVSRGSGGPTVEGFVSIFLCVV